MPADTIITNPDAADIIIALDPAVQNFLAITLAFMMLAVALGLKAADFDFIKKNPTSILIGSAAQLIGLPLLTLGFIILLDIRADISLGMVIVACCPGGNVSNLLTRISNSDAAYSVALTTVSSVFAAVMLPITILFWTGLYAPTAALLQQINIDRASFILQTTMTLAIPLAVGLYASRRWPDISARISKKLIPISALMLLAIVILATKSNMGMVTEYGMAIMPLIIAHNGAAFLIGFLIGYFFLKDRRKARALTFEVGLQNTGLGLLIVISQLSGLFGAVLVVAMWGLWHLVAGLLLAGFFRLYDKLASKKSATPLSGTT